MAGRIAGASDGLRPSSRRHSNQLTDELRTDSKRQPHQPAFGRTSRACARSRSPPCCSATPGVPFLAGGYVGVDVFFVISGFLITRLLLGELERTGAHLAAPLLRPPGQAPAAALGGPARRRRRSSRCCSSRPVRAVEVSGDIVSSALYTANWHFAAQSVDYFAQDVEPSPVLHLWSLAIEEQFYVVWPTLLLARHLVLAPPRRSVRPALWVTLAVVLVGSLRARHPPHRRPARRRLLLDLRARLGARPGRRRWRCSGRCASAPARGGRDRLGRPRRDRLRRVRLRRRPPRSPGTAALLPTLGTACLILAGASIYAPGQGRPCRPALAGAGPLRRPHLLLLVPLALAGADLRRGDLGARSRSPPASPSSPPPGSRPPLTHDLIEDPVRRLPGARPPPEPRPRASALACMAIGVGAGVLLTDAQPTLDTAPLADVKGAAALAEQPDPQQRADAVRPEPAAGPRRPLARLLRRLPGRHRRHQLEPVPLRRPRAATGR